MRTIEYHNAVKVFLHFWHPFWLDEGIHGGCSVTDHPVRFVYYPPPEETGSDGGVLLASYTWARESRIWEQTPPDERPRLALEGIQDLHGTDVARWFASGRSINWASESFSRGAYAHLAPGQGVGFRQACAAPEGGIHFAGEHTSSWNGWIEGAVESGVRVALEIAEETPG